MSYAVSPSMSDDERDIDIESDEEDGGGYSRGSGQYSQQVDKRAHHNALERKRRDHIKDSFSGLRDSVPSLQGEKASRAQILKKAADYIQFMRRKNAAHQQDIDDLKRQNEVLQTQIRSLEKAKMLNVGDMHTQAEAGKYQEDSEGSDRENSTKGKRSNKKMKTSV
ncbi:protein max-like isoform X2 [Daphnia pulex]|uniref:protein max-like isoform X2 n=1 Tax=Daphnia pulex TaxID=6669 RepID=UPI001EDD85E0|nr:protein max-like isoform X2 [Daphnia pulex]XP_046638528.1 protein max-like isoform X2 [Daphnia pulicaria]